MNSALAQMYGTGGVDTEEQEKIANLELFAKLAAQHNIDLSSLSDEQVQELYAQTFDTEMPKTASDDEDDEDKEDKKAKAEEYVEEKKAFQEKFAEADLMGRVMAHAFVQERDEIEKAAKKTEVGMPQNKPAPASPKSGTLLGMPPNANKEPGKGAVAWAKAKGKGGKALEAVKRFSHTNKGKAVGAALGGAALAGGGYAAYKGLKGKEKKSSAEQFEELAAEQAIKIAAAAGFDADEAFNRVNAAYILGVAETEKIASVQNVDDALHIRGLEYLEAVGYPVDWSEIYGE